MSWLLKIARKQPYAVVLEDITFIVLRIWNAAIGIEMFQCVCVRELDNATGRTIIIL